MSLAEIRDDLEDIVERHGSETSAQERIDLLVLTDLLVELDVEETDHSNAVEQVVQVRERIETLMGEFRLDGSKIWSELTTTRR